MTSSLTAEFIDAWAVIGINPLQKDKQSVIGVYLSETLALKMAEENGIPSEIKKIKAVRFSDGDQFAIGLEEQKRDSLLENMLFQQILEALK